MGVVISNTEKESLLLTGPYAGFSEGGFEMENLVTENELSLQVDPS